MIILKAILILTLVFVCLQDIKERQVYWFLFTAIGGLCGILFYKSTLPELFLNAIIMNVVFVSMLILVIFMYSKFRLKSKFLDVIGLGDLLLFIGLSLSFSTVSFIVIFISSLVFSLVLHVLIKKKSSFTTVPLAGYMSLFFSITYLSYWSGLIDNLYIL